MSLHAPLRGTRSRTSFLGGATPFLLPFLIVGSASAQGPTQRLPASIHPETSSAAEALLKTAASHLRQEQWDSAVELYQRAIQQFPDALTSLDDGVPADANDGVGVFVNVSDYAQQRIASLPPQALRAYRARVDGEARHLFEQGRSRLDPEPLRRVVTTFFCSSWGDDAAELLADLAFQEGRFDEATRLYRRLLPSPDEEPSATIYPDPDIDIARVAAKAILCAEAAGQRSGDGDLREFATRFPAAEGELAGRRGSYSETLGSALIEDGLRVPSSVDARWPTFAGDPTRTKVIPEPVDPGALVWSIPLRAPFDVASNVNATPSRFGADFGMPEDDTPAFFPVLQDDEVLLTDGRMVQSFALEGGPDGHATPAPTWRAVLPSASPSASRPNFGIDRHTLTVLGSRIYARLGPFGTDFQGRNAASAPPTAIVALDRSRSDTPLWSRSADEVIAGPGQTNRAALSGQVAFGGAPLADEHGVYVTLIKPGTQSLTWVACLDPETGRTRWVRYVCSGTSQHFNRAMGGRNRGLIFNPDLGHRLLAIGGSTLYYQTDLGALASIDARTGRLNWLATYPRILGASRGGLAETIGHNPAVVHGDRVVIAPEDSDRIFAFERETGRLSWQVDPGGRVGHLLGVASGKVIATGNHVWTIDVRSGELRSRWPDGPTLEQGYGRGLLAGGEIYWPTRDVLYILDQESGRPTDRPPISLREAFGCGGGNLVAGDGYLLIAERDRLRVFCKPSRMLRYYSDRIAAEPDEPSHHYRLARTAEALGEDELALDSLSKSLERARPGDRIDGRRLVDAARAERFKIHMKLAARRLAEDDPDGAIGQFERAVESSPGPLERLEAELGRADALAATGDPTGSVDALQRLLDRPEVRELDLPADDRRSLRAELLIVDRLRDLIRRSGPRVYAKHDAAAAELFHRGLDAQDSRLLGGVVRSYPVSSFAPAALDAIGDLESRRGAWSEAARAYHQLVISSGDDLQRARGLVGLARCYEALELSNESREAYELAASLYGSMEVDLAGFPQRMDEFVADRLASGPGSRGLASNPFDPPLGRLDRRRWPSGFAPLDLDDPTGGLGAGAARPVVLIGETALRGVDAGSGDRLWEATLGDRPVWSGVAGGRLIAASSDRIIGLDPADGSLLWEVMTEAGELAFAPPAPDRAGGGGPRTVPPSSRFHRFRLHGDQLYFLRGDRDLVCLDPVIGRPRWSYRTSAVAIDPHLGLGLSRVAIQLRMPNAIAVLDARDGRTLGQFAQDESAGPWRRDPFPVAFDRMAIVPDGSSIVLLDLVSGRTIWEAREASALPSSPRPSPGDPLVMGDAERLLAVRGETLQRLDPSDGKVMWSAPLGRIRSDRRAEAMALGHEAVFFLSSGGSGLAVGAVSLPDGERLWTEPLPGVTNETWGLGLTTDCVMAYRLDDGTPGSRSEEPIVLNLLRRDSGRRIQRLVLEAEGPGRRVRIQGGGVTVAGATGLWRLAAARDGEGRDAAPGAADH